MPAAPPNCISFLCLTLLGFGLLTGCLPNIERPLRGDINYSLGSQASRWKLSSVPIGWEGEGYNRANAGTWLRHNDRRAKLSWYIVDNLFYRSSGGSKPANIGPEDIKLNYVRPVGPQEIYPDRDLNAVNLNETVFDLAYYPAERGQYNYNPDLTPEGKLKNPFLNWGGITRAINFDTNFELTKVTYLDFWMMDPFLAGPLGAIEGKVYDPSTKGREGVLTLDLGDISEDLLSDSRMMFEQGLPNRGQKTGVDSTPFGKVPQDPLIQYSFENDPVSRPYQDVGMDGLNNEEERSRFAGYLDEIRPRVNPEVAQRIEADPSNDDFLYFLNDQYDQEDAKILERYKRFNNLQGNSPIEGGSSWTPSYTNQPDMEDINQDNMLNQQDAYYSYRIQIAQEHLVVGKNYIVEKREGPPVAWYHFRIPIQDLTHPNFGGSTGSVAGFGRIRFMRIRLTGMAEPTVLRFVNLSFVVPK